MKVSPPIFGPIPFLIHEFEGARSGRKFGDKVRFDFKYFY